MTEEQCHGCKYFRLKRCNKANKAVSSLTECPEGLWQAQPDSVIAPYRHKCKAPWEGTAPWTHSPVSVIIPVLELNETLPTVIALLQKQTVRPLIYIVDTGSIRTTAELEALRSPSVEVLHLRTQGWPHGSWPVSAALDAAWGCINTPYAFLTHDDCFLQKQTTLSELMALCSIHKAVGHQISPRTYEGWQNEFGHTCLMLSVPDMDAINMTWNFRKWGVAVGKSIVSSKCLPNKPDTETMMNHLLHVNGLTPSFNAPPGKPLFIGTEQNAVRNIDPWIDHCRSMTCGMLYSMEHYQKVKLWVQDAMAQANERLASWNLETKSLPS